MISEYLKGNKLYGDDFAINQIKQWFEEEKEWYSGLGSCNTNTYKYGYHEISKQLGFKHIPNHVFKNVLGFGSAYGDEFLPIIDKIGTLTIIEPSLVLRKPDVKGKKINYIEPEIDGHLNISDNQFNLITSLGVLHHIPNVTYVLKEIHRVLDFGNYFLLREPITTMGDWRFQRKGLTKNERGIPKKILETMLNDIGFRTIKKSYCFFPVAKYFAKLLSIEPYNNELLVKNRFNTVSFLYLALQIPSH